MIMGTDLMGTDLNPDPNRTDLQHLQVILRDRRPADLPVLARWLGDPQAQWRQWDAPYLHAKETTETLQAYLRYLENSPPAADQLVIELGGQVVGMVNRSEEPPEGGGWWDLGILIYNPEYWGGGIGTRALARWVQDTLDWTDAHTLTVTTWSGNQRMIRAAQKLGFQEWMRVREARVVNGQRYDSIKLGLLRREWASLDIF